MNKTFVDELKDDIENFLSKPLYDFYDYHYNFRTCIHYDFDLILDMHPVIMRTIIFAQFFSVQLKNDPDFAKELFLLADERKKTLGK
ncbi:MAG: hypothetical protein GY828_01975 [Candidatus Gracilibacteria bacterium]|nr:hypothetical protein [Candidatus Gracilibacteria bacterium]